MDHPELDGLTLAELVGRLRDVHTTRTPLGWPTEQAVTKSSVERRIVELVTRREPAPVTDPGQRLVCEIDLKLRSANRPSLKVNRVTLQIGGLFVETPRPEISPGEPVELELRAENDYRMRIRGNVGFLSHAEPTGIGIGFTTVVGDAAERRLERMVLELVKNRAMA
jgi:hypothetical protein